jgi:arylsulfatase
MNEEYADVDKFIFTPEQLHKVVFDIKNPEEKVGASEYSVIE